MKHLLALVALGAMTSVSLAGSVSPFNDRPLSVASAPSGEDDLQDILDDYFGSGALDKYDDQQSAGYFTVATSGSAAILPQLYIEQSDDADYNEFGLFTLPGLDDANSPVHVKLFDGSDDGTGNKFTAPTVMVKWTSPSTGYVGISSNTFSGLTIGAFGVYLKDKSGNYWYSLDEMNANDTARVLTYTDGNTNWGFAFEDGSDGDANDAFIFIESITPVPEPGTLALCGIALLGGFALRRRRNRA